MLQMNFISQQKLTDEQGGQAACFLLSPVFSALSRATRPAHSFWKSLHVAFIMLLPG